MSQAAARQVQEATVADRGLLMEQPRDWRQDYRRA